MKKFSSRALKSFTLVELMVVVMIILIMSTFVILELSGAQKKARDERRISDVNNIASALNQYYISNDRQFPTICESGGGVDTGSCKISAYNSDFVSNMQFVQAMNSYLSPMPADPKPEWANNYIYVWNKDKNAAVIFVNQLETGSSMCNINSGNLDSLPDIVRAYVGGDSALSISNWSSSGSTTGLPCYYVIP